MKAQSEIMGLAMVMVLVAFGLVFIVSFIVLTDDGDIRGDFIDKQMAVNINNAILDTNTQCRGNTVRRLLVDCVDSRNVICSAGVNSCDFLFENGTQDQGVIPYLLNETLDQFGYTYYYKSYVRNSAAQTTSLHDIIGNVNRCPRSQIPGIFFLPTQQGDLFLELYICE